MSQGSPDQDRDTEAPAPLPEGWRLTPSPGLRTKSAGRILIGGAPLKIMRLSARGATISRSWFAGEAVSGERSHQQLARRLLDAGMANPRFESTEGHGPDTSAAPITVVIPVKDDPVGLNNTLSRLGHPRPGQEPSVPLPVVVVDDGSREPVTTDDDRLLVLRNPEPRGPGAARQRALGHVTTPLVAFVDAGVLVSAADLRRLAEALADRSLVAAAPRVLSSPQDHLVGRYETIRSPLDLGAAESLVGQGRGVPYVPTACMLVRTDAIDEVGGFDPGLRYGEDVDLVWRLNAVGDVRYLPEVTVSHPPRSGLAEMVRQRSGYGSAAAPLADRHGDAVAPCVTSPWSLLVTVLFASGHPVIGAAAAVSTGLALRPKIKPLPDLTAEAFQITIRGHWYAGLSTLIALARTWSPLAIAVATVVPSQRRPLLALLGAGFARRLLDGPRKPVEALTDVTVGVVDDLAYASGVWRGVIRSRSPRALLPTITSWPKAADRQPQDRQP